MGTNYKLLPLSAVHHGIKIQFRYGRGSKTSINWSVWQNGKITVPNEYSFFITGSKMPTFYLDSWRESLHAFKIGDRYLQLREPCQEEHEPVSKWDSLSQGVMNESSQSPSRFKKS